MSLVLEAYFICAHQIDVFIAQCFVLQEIQILLRASVEITKAHICTLNWNTFNNCDLWFVSVSKVGILLISALSYSLADGLVSSQTTNEDNQDWFFNLLLHCHDIFYFFEDFEEIGAEFVNWADDLFNDFIFHLQFVSLETFLNTRLGFFLLHLLTSYFL